MMEPNRKKSSFLLYTACGHNTDICHYNHHDHHLIDGLGLLHLHLTGRRVDTVRNLSLDGY